MHRVATCIIEVRDGHVTNYRGNYDSYLYSVNKEIEDGEREAALRMSKPPASVGKPVPASRQAPRRGEKDLRKEMTALERNIAKLDPQKREIHRQLMEATDPAEALRLHNEFTALTVQLAEVEEQWVKLQEELSSLE